MDHKQRTVSDTTNPPPEVLEPTIGPRKLGGRPRETDICDVLNAIYDDRLPNREDNYLGGDLADPTL